MSRIAIQFFGHLRTFEKCFPSLKRRLLNHYDCDIFMHTWDMYNHNTQTRHKNANKTVDKQYLMKKLGISEEQIIIEHQEIYNTGHYRGRGCTFGLQGIVSMYRSINTVNNIREKYQKKHKVKYDMVVCIRPDILLTDSLKLEKYINDEFNQDGKNFYFPGRLPDRTIYGFNCVELIDLLFFAKPDAMTKFCSISYLPIKDGDVISYAPEGFLVDKVLKAKLKPVYLADFKSFRIKRPLQHLHLSRSSIISLHLNKKGIYFQLLRIFPPIIDIKTKIFNRFDIWFSIGKID